MWGGFEFLGSVIGCVIELGIYGIDIGKSVQNPPIATIDCKVSVPGLLCSFIRNEHMYISFNSVFH